MKITCSKYNYCVLKHDEIQQMRIFAKLFFSEFSSIAMKEFGDESHFAHSKNNHCKIKNTFYKKKKSLHHFYDSFFACY